MKKMKLLISLFFITVFIACGQKKDDTFTKPMYFPQGIYIGTDPTLHLTWSTGSGMVWPSAGIPVSTGSGWSGSITNNSAHWDLGYQAYLWGNHAGLYKLLNAKVDYVGEVINKPDEVELAVALPTLNGIPFPVKTQAEINALTPVKGLVLINSTDNVMQWYNGTKWIVFATTNQ
jgi:hypothetical protein